MYSADHLTIIGALLIVLQLGIVLSVLCRVILTRHPPGSAFAWMLLTVSLPFVGFMLYLMFGERPIGRIRMRMLERAAEHWGKLGQHRLTAYGPLPQQLIRHRAFIRLAAHLAGMPVFGNTKVELKSSSVATLASLHQDIMHARRSIDMEFYIWDDGGSVSAITQAILDARHRGVRVRLLVDDFGSRAFLRSDSRKALEDAGVEIAAAMPMKLLRFFGLQRADIRLHRKTVVIDDQIAYTGSFNMIDPHHYAEAPIVGSWVDAMVRVEGPGAKSLEAVWRFDWAIQPDGDPSDFPENVSEAPIASAGNATVITIPSGPYQSGDRNLLLILDAIARAEHSLTITTPYFIPTESVVLALLNAALRGVDVKLIVPARADSAAVNWAMRRYFDFLLEGGVRILSYEGGLLHTKSIAVDGEFAIFGTLNIDNRSLHLNFELMMAIFDEGFMDSLKELHAAYEAKSKEILWEQWRERPLTERFKEGAAYLMSPLL